jgi:hypothetical protein
MHRARLRAAKLQIDIVTLRAALFPTLSRLLKRILAKSGDVLGNENLQGSDHGKQRNSGGNYAGNDCPRRKHAALSRLHHSRPASRHSIALAI